MTYARQYSVQEVEDILEKSEKRKSPISKVKGHAIKMHRDRDNENLKIVGKKRKNLPRDSAFMNTKKNPHKKQKTKHYSDQAWAVTQALNSPTGQTELKALDKREENKEPIDRKEDRRVIKNTPVGFPKGIPAKQRVSKKISNSKNRSLFKEDIKDVTVVIERIPGGKKPHVQTAYPN